MRQRVMIAIAIACRPKLLLADEPTTALDVTIQDQILALLAELQDEFGMAMILVSHDLGVVAQNCDSVAVMYAGHVVEDAPAADALPRAAPPVHGRACSRRCPSIRERRHARPARRRSAASRPTSRGCRAAARSGPAAASARDACAEVTMELEPAGPGHVTACPFCAGWPRERASSAARGRPASSKRFDAAAIAREPARRAPSARG